MLFLFGHKKCCEQYSRGVLLYIIEKLSLKGQPKEFFASVFFINELILVPLGMSQGRFDFFHFFMELLDFFQT